MPVHAAEPPPPGRHEIEAGICYVPPAPPRRVVIMLHGAGGTAEAGLRLLLPYADENALLLYAPQSAGSTWDVILGRYGPDVDRIQAALPRLTGPPLAIGGFSDGASYALSLALTNGDLFDSVIAFSPGFAAPIETRGSPRFFISHGRTDRILPIERCGSRLARALRATGYDVEYQEFDGGHEIPPEVTVAALDWLLR